MAIACPVWVSGAHTRLGFPEPEDGLLFPDVAAMYQSPYFAFTACHSLLYGYCLS